MRVYESMSMSLLRKTILLFSLLLCAVIWLPQSTFGVIEEFLILLIPVFLLLRNTKGEKKADIKAIGVTVVSLLVFLFCYWWKWHADYLFGQIANGLGLGISQSTLVLIIAVIGCAISGYAVYLTAKSTSCQPNMDAEIAVSTRLQSLDYLIAFVLAFLCAMQFALNPLFPLSPMGDSSIFLFVGERLHDGQTLYVDVFDHKGPVQFFLQWLGLCIPSGTWSGVWLVELVNMTAFAIVVMKTSALFSRSRTVHVLATVITLFIAGMQAYDEGNYTEEYALPWIGLSLYIFLNYFITKEYRKRDLVLLGISAAVVLLLRANMIGVWAALIPATLVSLILQKRWKDIGYSVLFFLVGMLVVIVPVCIIAYSGGWLGAMWQYYVMYNFTYAASDGSSLPNLLSTMVFLAGRMSLGLVLVLALPLNSRNRVALLNLLAFAVSLLLASMSGRMYSHYAMVLIPFVVMPCTFWVDGLLDRSLVSRIPSMIKTGLPLICSLLILATIFISMVFFPRQFSHTEVSRYLEENTEPDDNVIIAGNHVYDYLRSGRSPRTTRFFFQNFPSQGLYEEFLDEFDFKDYDCIVVEQPFAESLEYGGFEGDFNRYLYDMFFRCGGGYVLDDRGSFYVYAKVE